MVAYIVVAWENPFTGIFCVHVVALDTKGKRMVFCVHVVFIVMKGMCTGFSVFWYVPRNVIWVIVMAVESVAVMEIPIQENPMCT